jgi:hypothetical protein
MDQHQQSHGIVPWFADWMKEREQARRRETTTRGGPTWDQVIHEFGNDGAGLLYTLIVMSHGRKEFDARIGDLMALLAMERSRFNQLVAQFAERGVIAVRHDGDNASWTILRQPDGACA